MGITKQRLTTQSVKDVEILRIEINLSSVFVKVVLWWQFDEVTHFQNDFE